MSNNVLNLTRDQLAAFLPNPRAVRAFEQLITQAGKLIPAEMARLSALIDDASNEGASGRAAANQAIDALSSMAESLETLASAPVQHVFTMGDLDDVSARLAVAGQVLIYDASLKRWKNARITPGENVAITNADGSITIGVARRKQIETPAATGFSVAVVSDVGGVTYDVWLLLKPAGAFAAGTIVLPAVASCIDQQVIAVSCTEQINSLTVDGNGATVDGAPSALAADATFKLRFDLASTTWHRAE